MNAKTHLEKAIALNPEFAEAYFELGMLLKEDGDIKESVKHLKKAVRNQRIVNLKVLQ